MLVTCLLSGCQSQDLLLRVGSNVWPGYEPFYIAREQGWLTSDIRLVEFPDSSTVMEAIRQGKLEAAALTLDEAMLLASEGLELTIIMVCDDSEGADVIVARPEIQTLQQLAGKRLAAETSAAGALMLEGLLNRAGLQHDQIELFPMSPAAMPYAYQQDRIDAAVTFAPHMFRLLDAGAKIMYTSAEIPGQIVDVLAVRSDMLDLHRQALVTLIGGFQRARSGLSLRQYQLIANQRLKLPEADLSQAWQGMNLPDRQENLQQLQGDSDSASARVLQHAHRLAALMTARGLLEQAELQNLSADASLVAEARQ
ncbi:ABC transporter substrate-binding protein [Oceanobacter mangrovi]|uniref:ABC transporter substrate-binding protein n=1 Tax=Oceanobacter mangrovi TaxID=2862510 RepID=UPI001C8D39AC|nr:ABC transporter substrate-binding protein [Oceanobacter mangrovi]